jgi:predicted RNA-binding Zn ribbon-like protein
MHKSSTQFKNPAFVFLGDHPVLDFLNSLPRVNGELVDLWNDDEDVLRWLAHAGIRANGSAEMEPLALLHAARLLREIIHKAIERRKSEKPVDVRPLNAFLAKCESHLELITLPQRSLEVERRWEARTPEQLLAPIAEAAAELLATGDFDLVRECEDQECVLWFYDRTKSHQRRWCSMAICGNRNKVAAFRERQQRHADK